MLSHLSKCLQKDDLDLSEIEPLIAGAIPAYAIEGMTLTHGTCGEQFLKDLTGNDRPHYYRGIALSNASNTQQQSAIKFRESKEEK